MAKLILSLDGVVLREYRLEKEKTGLGRKPSNDIQIDNLAVSGEHALITTIGHDSFLEDLDSTNGTLVNGAPVQKHFLKDNDLIEVGKYKLKYIREAVASAESDDFEKTMVLRGPAKAASVAPHAAPPVAPVKPAVATPAPAAAPEPPLGVVQVLNGPSAGKELELVKNLTTLGKPGVQVAVITRRPQGYFITHVEGAHFPQVNGRAIDAQAHALADGDVVELGGVKMQFSLRS